jgi:hypothetical protein
VVFADVTDAKVSELKLSIAVNADVAVFTEVGLPIQSFPDVAVEGGSSN